MVILETFLLEGHQKLAFVKFAISRHSFRLTTLSCAFATDSSAWRLFFQKAAKGLALSFKDWQNAEFVLR